MVNLANLENVTDGMSDDGIPCFVGYLPDENGHQVAVIGYGSFDPTAQVVFNVHGGPHVTGYEEEKGPHANVQKIYDDLDNKNTLVLEIHQRGVGLSKFEPTLDQKNDPAAFMQNNEIIHFVEDMHRVTQNVLDNKKIILFGGSEGANKIRLFIEKYAQCVAGSIIRNPFNAELNLQKTLFSPDISGLQEIEKDLQSAWRDVLSFLKMPAETELEDIFNAMFNALVSPEEDIWKQAAVVFENVPNARNKRPFRKPAEMTLDQRRLAITFLDPYLEHVGHYFRDAKRDPYLVDDTQFSQLVDQYKIPVFMVIGLKDTVIPKGYFDALLDNHAEGIEIRTAENGLHPLEGETAEVCFEALRDMMRSLPMPEKHHNLGVYTFG